MRRHLALALLLLLAPLLAGCTGTPEGSDARTVDSDLDGLSDNQEADGWVVTVQTEGGKEQRAVHPDPKRVDTDGDGLSDWEEFYLRSDPTRVDTDGDGLLDGENLEAGADSERARALRALRIVEDPLTPGRFLGEQSHCPTSNGTDPLDWNSDLPVKDTLGDGEELRGWTLTIGGESRRVFSSPCVPDTDGDGLLDHEEKARGTDPTRKDTDDDGVWDSLDADPFQDLALRVRVREMRLADAPSEGNVTLVVSIAGEEQRFTVPTSGGGTFPVDVTHEVNVDDSTVDFTHLNQTVLLRVTDTGRGNLAVAAAGDPAVVTYDMLGNVWGHEGQAGSGLLATEGADGGLTVEFEVAVATAPA